MRTLIVVGLMAFSACAFAETDSSFLSKMCAFLFESEPKADSEAMKDSAIAQLSQQINDLKAKYEAVKSVSSDEADVLKKKLDELKASFNRKVEEFKTARQKKLDEAKAKREAEKAEAKAATNATSLVNGVLNLFK